MNHTVGSSTLDSQTEHYASKFLTLANIAPGVACESTRSPSVNKQSGEYVTRFLEPAKHTSEVTYENNPSSFRLKKPNVDYLARFSASTTDAASVAYGKNFVKRQVEWFDKVFGAPKKSTQPEEIQLDKKCLHNNYLEVIGENEYQNIDNLGGSP